MLFRLSSQSQWRTCIPCAIDIHEMGRSQPLAVGTTSLWHTDISMRHRQVHVSGALTMKCTTNKYLWGTLLTCATDMGSMDKNFSTSATIINIVIEIIELIANSLTISPIGDEIYYYKWWKMAM